MEKNYRAELTGVFGDPVDGNPTGVMEEAAYAALWPFRPRSALQRKKASGEEIAFPAGRG